MYKILLFIILAVEFIYGSQAISPIPNAIQVNPTKVALGKELFFDTQLSKNNAISCATCHLLESGGDDNLRFSFGLNGQEGVINAPTVYNAVFNFRQFWDGRAKDLQAQAEKPIENPIEMGHTFKELIPQLNKTAYKTKFATIYKDGITKNNITNAIAEFEKTLITPDAAFDRYLKGDENALTSQEKDGYELFKSKGCISCHHGVNIGGNLYNKFGIFEDTNSSNLGRYNVTHRERDKYYFKVPSLRNIARTAPYFHDGRTSNLRKSVELMARVQLGRKITAQEIDNIVAFLKSLNGKIPKIEHKP